MNIESLIRQYVQFRGKETAQGWIPILCRVCNDSGHKGPRAAFKFGESGELASYHCFNCGHAAAYSSNSGSRFSRNFRIVLDAFQVPWSESSAILEKAFMSGNGFERTEPRMSAAEIAANIPVTVELPRNSYKVDGNSDDDMSLIASHYLKERGIDWQSQDFYVAKLTGDPVDDRWAPRLIIPIYYEERIVYYMGRDMSNSLPRKYLNAKQGASNIIYGFDKLCEDHDRPLYIVEGWFDAAIIDGIAVFGRTMTTGQAYWINSSRRPKVVIPDTNKDGFDLATQAIDLGWSVALPDIGTCGDINEAVNTYGKLYVLDSIRRNTYSGEQGRLLAELYCNA